MLKEVLSVSALIVVVLLVRAIFKNRVPKRMIYALWLVVLLKLCLPGTLFSLPVLPAAKLVAPTQISELPAQTTPVIQQPAQTVMQPQAPAQQPVSPVQETVKPAAKPLATAQIFQIVWFGGSALLGLWLLGAWVVFTIRLHRDRRFLGKRGGTRIYVSGAVKSPCLAGFIPAVYLTEDVLQADEAELILRHELTHLRHLDFLWSFCRTAAVIAYWWNPFIWLAAICSKRDAELACDEAVSAGLSDAQRLAYARAILAQAPRMAAALSLAGPPVRERILFLTKKQRTSVLCVILALLLVMSAAGCSITELTRQKSGEITLPKETQTVQVETTTNITPQADAWREANLPTEYDLLGCCDFVDWFILLTGSKAPGSSENTGYTAFQAFVVQKDGEDYTLAAWNDTSEWDSSVGFMVHTLVTNDRTVIYGFTTDTVFGVWDQENRHDVSFDEITVTFQDSSIPLTRSIDPGKPFLTFSEGTRSIADISFSDGERTANWSDVSGDGLNEPSEPLDCAPLLSKKSSCTTSLPTPASSMFGLTGREATLYDAAVSQKYPRSDNDIVLPSLRVRGSFEEDGKTVVICDLHYDFYYDYTGPGWEWNGGGATTYLRAELETRSGAEICTGFAEYPSGSLSDWIRDYCAPLAMQDADGAWVLPETAENWFPSDGSMLGEYLAAAEAIQKPTAILDGSIDLSAMSVDALGQLLDELNVLRPDGKKAQNEKWAAISTVKTELVNRAKESGYSYREPVTFETLNEMIGYRLMNNESLMNAFPDDAAQMEACRKENAAIETFRATLPESGSDEEAYAYWRQYWQDVLHQEAPSYFVPAMTLTIFALNTSPSSKKTYTLSAEDATVVETLFSIDSMTPATSDSESVCAYQFDIENRSYLLDDSRDYVDAIVRESDDDYKYYGKHLSDAEIESLREIIEAYAE